MTTILHINTFDTGGAAKAVTRLHDLFLEYGYNSSLLVMAASRPDSPRTYFPYGHKLARKLCPAIQELSARWSTRGAYDVARGLYSRPLIGTDISNHPLVRQADILYLHWVQHGFLALRHIAKLLALGKPVVWVLHDMWAMTGGCHHAFECTRYTECCKMCPHLKTPGERDMAYQVFAGKLSMLRGVSNLHVVTPSRWLGDCARQSRLFRGVPVRVIPHTLDARIYRPIDRTLCRELCGLPRDKRVLLFGAHGGAANPYKGWSYLKEALGALAMKRDDLVACVFGSAGDERLRGEIPVPTYFPGWVTDDVALSVLYNAVDMFVSASVAESFSNTVLESLACGVPPVGFGVGGVLDLIDHRVNGYLAEPRDAEDLASGILWALGANVDTVREAARTKALRVAAGDAVIDMHRKVWVEAGISSE